MKILAVYTVVAMAAFVAYSAYYALVGDNSPFWIFIVVVCLPIIAFAALCLIRKR